MWNIIGITINSGLLFIWQNTRWVAQFSEQRFNNYKYLLENIEIPTYNFYITSVTLAYFSLHLSLILSTESNLGYSAMAKLVLKISVSEQQIKIVPQIQTAWVKLFCLYQQIEMDGKVYILLCMF